MDFAARQLHLSRISTAWTVVRRAHASERDGQADAARQAQAELVERYAPAAHRYLTALLRDEDAADEAFQDFAIRLLRGDLRRADPERGRFRDYLKRTLINLARDRQRVKYGPRPLESGMEPAAPAEAPDAELDREFLNVWRDELLGRAWDALAVAERSGGQPHFTILRLRGESPGASSDELAAQLTRQISAASPISAAHARKLLQRARESFAQLLLDEIAGSIGEVNSDAIEDELIKLDLRQYCASALQRRREKEPNKPS
jgi:RNA polymerase sigma-70 factor (ECF subfamily)